MAKRYKCPECGSSKYIDVTGTITGRMLTNDEGEEEGFDFEDSDLDYEEGHANAVCMKSGCASTAMNLHQFEYVEMPMTDGLKLTTLTAAIENFLELQGGEEFDPENQPTMWNAAEELRRAIVLAKTSQSPSRIDGWEKVGLWTLTRGKIFMLHPQDQFEYVVVAVNGDGTVNVVESGGRDPLLPRRLQANNDVYVKGAE